MTASNVRKPDSDTPMSSPSWAPEPPALDMEPEPPAAENPEIDAEDEAQPPARSGGTMPNKRPAEAYRQAGRANPENRIAPQVVGDKII